MPLSGLGPHEPVTASAGLQPGRTSLMELENDQVSKDWVQGPGPERTRTAENRGRSLVLPLVVSRVFYSCLALHGRLVQSRAGSGLVYAQPAEGGGGCNALLRLFPSATALRG